jgi:group I intron endonuclease
MENGYFKFLKSNLIHVPKQFGVYKISNLINSKCYIGSSKNIYRRLYNHLRELSSNNSPHIKLQNAVNKYSLDNFVVSILWTAPDSTKEELLKQEQKFIDVFNCVNSGYNILYLAGSALGYKMSKQLRDNLPATKLWQIIYPDGREELISNLTDFCEIYKLKNSSLRSVAFGKSTSYKGYKCYDPDTKDSILLQNTAKPYHKHRYKITEPSGNVVFVDSLRQYCLSNNLEYKFLHKLTKQGRRTATSGRGSGGRHQGYYCEFVD